MFRESLSSGATYALLAITSGSGALLQSQTLLAFSHLLPAPAQAPIKRLITCAW